ncbi:helix-turn-helix transcriptional regulator [Nocardioides sp. BYT-33-1]|uniref:helix-turn-helix transcriptional regulator n=1 Tax=Nocardioides sp. BYT-33-1 TaxID=3416952 RepID=UPI003F53D430
MTEQMLRREDVGFRLAEISLADPAGRYAQVLDLLREVGDAPAAVLVRPAAADSGVEVLAASGYTPEIVDAIASSDFVVKDPAYQAILGDPDRPLRCWRDLEFDYASTDLARDLLLPAGFHGGVSVRLEDSAGGYRGDLHMSTEDRSFPTDAAMDLMRRSGPILAALCGDRPPPRIAGPGAPGDGRSLLVRPDGSVDPLADGCAASAPDPELVGLARMLAGRVGAVGRSLRRMQRWRGADGTPRSVSTDVVPGGTLVTIRDEPLPHRLTWRELEVLTLLTAGLPNFSIARRLELSERTVAHCVERIFAKLDVAARAEAAATAERDGLTLVDVG